MENKTILQEILEDTSSKNILVSASAGTGKTYTMVQKAISLLINDDECSLDNILMLTFSREAAGNMRSKIEKEIRNILVEKGEQFKYLNDDQKNKLRTQLNKLPTAQISTLDSFTSTS